MILIISSFCMTIFVSSIFFETPNAITSENYDVKYIIEVLTVDSFTCVTSVDIDCLNEITLSGLKSPGKTIHLKVVLNEPAEVQGDGTHAPPTKMLRTLMDIARTEWYKTLTKSHTCRTLLQRTS